MARAQGAGNRIAGGGLGVPAYARVYAIVQPLGGPNPGTYDANGNYLHFRYTGNLDLGARSGGNQMNGGAVAADFMPNRIVVEFDAQSCFTLPFEGQLELVGGEGDWKFGIEVHETVDPQFYQPEFRTLRTFKTRGSVFTVPDAHTYLVSSNPAATFLDGGTIITPGAVFPGISVTAGQELTVGPSNTWIITGWKG